ncbi:MAG: hypothetical protein M1830_004217, partial [Pleopsidium flavum]
DVEAYDSARDEAVQHELAAFLQVINMNALIARASALREGISCSVATPNLDKTALASAMGNVNYHIELCFRDGISWIARIKRRNASTPPAAVREYMIRSEIATYRFLEKTDVPTPKVFDYVVGSDNPVGVGYILMEKIPGRPLPSTSHTMEQMQKVLGQLADVYVELERHPFDAMGSLDQPGTDHIGALASELLAEVVVEKNDSSFVYPDLLGPFVAAREYYVTMISRILDMIVSGELYPLWTVDTFLIHRFLLDLVPLLLNPTPPFMDDGAKFYLRHADDKGDHILVDDEFNITGIIDWEWAYTAPKAEAFSSPLALWNVGDFFDGSNELSENEQAFADLLDTKSCHGAVGLGHYVRSGKRQQRFQFISGYELYDWDFNGYVSIFAGLRKVFGVDADVEWGEWRQSALERYRHDDRLKVLLRKQAYEYDRRTCQ